MTVPPEISDLVIRLSELALKNTASAVFTRVQTVRARKQGEATTTELVEIINELLDEKAQLIGIARGFESQVVAQRISDKDLTFITEHLLPTVEKLISMQGDTESLDAETVELIKELLSKETFEILQLVGFNFKAAIGQPLTDIVERLILKQVPTSDTSEQVELLNHQWAVIIARVSEDAEAYARLRKLQGHVD